MRERLGCPRRVAPAGLRVLEEGQSRLVRGAVLTLIGIGRDLRVGLEGVRAALGRDQLGRPHDDLEPLHQWEGALGNDQIVRRLPLDDDEAVPGDAVRLTRDGKVVNERLLDQPVIA